MTCHARLLSCQEGSRECRNQFPPQKKSAAQNAAQTNVKMSRNNWKEEENRLKLDKAVSEYNDHGTNLRHLGRKYEISYSVLQRAVTKSGNSKKGRKFNCDELLIHQSDSMIEVPTNTVVISDVLKVWRQESKEECLKNKRRRKEIFVILQKNINFCWPHTAEEFKGDEIIHIVLHLGRHFAYIRADGRVLSYYDSGRSATTTRNASNAAKTMKAVAETLNEQMKKEYTFIYEIEESPKQSNGNDCGAFALFFIECNMRGYKIKPSLTPTEINNYRGRLQLIVNGEESVSNFKKLYGLNKRDKSKKKTAPRVVDSSKVIELDSDSE